MQFKQWLESQADYRTCHVNDELQAENWLGDIFHRIGNAWNAFWTDPNANNNLTGRIQTAKKALADLEYMLNQQEDSNDLEVALRGVRQSLKIVGTVEPVISELGGGGGVHPNNSPLPTKELNDAWMRIMQYRNQIISMPDGDDKLQKLKENNDELRQFKQQLEQIYRQPGPSNQQTLDYKKKIGDFLRKVDQDANLRKIENLLDSTRRRDSGNSLVQWPKGYQEVFAAWQQISQSTNDPQQQKAQLVAWYQQLQPQHPVKAFIQQEIQKNGGDENAMFLHYAQEWITKQPHHLMQ